MSYTAATKFGQRVFVSAAAQRRWYKNRRQARKYKARHRHELAQQKLRDAFREKRAPSRLLARVARYLKGAR